MSHESRRDDKFLENLGIIVCLFESHSCFGANGALTWPYNLEDSLSIIECYSTSLTTDQLINDITSERETELEYNPFWLRLTDQTFNFDLNVAEYDQKNLINEISYNKESVKIKDWPNGCIITSALFHVIISNVRFIQNLFNI